MAQHTAQWHGGDVHTKTFWMDGVWAGLIAGAGFMVLEMLLVWALAGQSPWGPPRMIAAMVLGEEVLPPSATFDVGIMMMAMAIHFMLSIVLGLLGAWIVHRFDMGMALLIGGVLGLATYIVNFLIIAPIAFPWFTNAPTGITIFSHIVFGVILGWAYVFLRNRRRGAPVSR